MSLPKHQWPRGDAWKKSDGFILFNGIEARPLATQELDQLQSRAFADPDTKRLEILLEKQGYSTQYAQAFGYVILEGSISVTGMAIPYSKMGEAWLIAYEDNSSIKAAMGTIHTEGDTRILELYDIRNGELSKEVITQSPDGTLLNRTTGEKVLAGSTACALGNLVCGFIKGTSCAFTGAFLWLLLSGACGPAAPEFFYVYGHLGGCVL